MNKINDFNKGTGAIRDRKDKRDYHFKEIAHALPPFDWVDGYDVEADLKITLPVKDQGTSGSCGGQAWANYGNVLTYVYDKTLTDRSARFIYAQTFVPGGGSAARANSDLVVNQGWASELSIPSMEHGQPPSEQFMEELGSVPLEAKRLARSDRALSYAQTDLDIDSVAQAIKASHGVVLGVSGQNNGTWLTTFPTSPKTSANIWDHWIYAGKAKTINGSKFIGILNSWGNVGINGWQWLSEDYFKTLINGQKAIWASWTLIFNPNKVDPSKEHYFGTDMVIGDTNNEVRSLQEVLQINGNYPKSVPTTGKYGEITRQSVLKFQQKYVSPINIWYSFVVWYSKGKSVNKVTRDRLNMLFAPLK